MKKLTNDQLYEKLTGLEEFAFRVPEETLSIVKVILENKKPKDPVRLGKIGKHIFYGKTQENLLEKGIELLDRIKYFKIKEVFNLLIRIVTAYEGKAVATQANKVIEGLTKYNLSVLKKVGYYPQKTLLKTISGWSDTNLKKRLSILLPILKAFLKPSFEGVTNEDYRTFTFHFGALSVTPEIIEIREHSIKLLKKLYGLSSKVEDKIKIIETLWEGELMPDQGSYGDDMMEMVRKSISEIVDFYLTIVPECENEVAKKIEKQLNWLKRRSPENTGNLPLEKLEALLSTKTDYDMFKDFVGYDHEFSAGDDWVEVKKGREERIKNAVKDITKDNLISWKEKIEKLLKNQEAAQPGEYQYFNNFLFELGKNKPDIALELISIRSIQPFLIHLIAGIWKSTDKETAKAIVRDWLKKGTELKLCAYLFSYVEEADIELMEETFAKATLKRDEIALTNLIDSIVRNYSRADLKELFLKTVSSLSRSKSWLWLHRLWFQADAIADSFSEKEVDVFLNAMILVPDVNYEMEAILKLIAEKYPDKVINYFLQRTKESTRLDFKSPHYDPVPFDLPNLAEVLSRKADIIIPLVFEWYKLGGKKDKWRYKWEASQLLSKIFPKSSGALEAEILRIIKEKKSDTLEVVYSILDKYEGEGFLFKVIEVLLQTYKKDPEIEDVKRHLFGYLSQTGTVMGEYGFVEAYEKKKKELDSLASPSKELASFVKEYKDHLEKRIEYEKKRADEDIALRQKGYED